MTVALSDARSALGRQAGTARCRGVQIRLEKFPLKN